MKNIEIVFIGGPLDRQRITTDSPVPAYWRHADSPAAGPMHVKPTGPGYASVITKDYKIHTIKEGYTQVYVGVLMETP